MCSSFFNGLHSLKWAVIVGTSVFLAIVASNGNDFSNFTSTQFTFGPGVDPNGKVEGISGPFQNSPECQNSKTCPDCGINSAWTPCCVKDEKKGKSYCSCSLASNACPELISVNTVKAGNRQGNTNLLGLDVPPLEANWETIAVQYRNDDYTETNEPITAWADEDGSVTYSITAASPTGSDQVVTANFLTVEHGAVRIAQDYLKKLGSEEIMRLLDKEIVQQIAKRYSSEISDEKVMEMN